MNEEYLKTLYEHIGGSEKGINYDSFKKDMSTNKEYNTTIYNHIGGKKSGIDYNSFINDTGLKKKDKSKLSSQEKLWGSSSKPKDVYTTLVTEAPKTATVSDSLNGKGKVKTQTPSKDKLTPINEDDENDDDFWSYLDNTLTSGIMSATKALIDTPEMLYDFAVQHAPEHGLDPTGAELPSSTFGVKSPKTAGVIMRDISEKNKIAPSKMLMKDLGISNVPSKHLKSGLDILNKKIEKKRQEYGGDPISAIEKGEYSNAAKLIAGTTVQSAPMMAIAIGTGGSAAGLTAIGTLTASQTYQQDIDNKKLSQGEKLGHAAISGVIESTLGHLFTGASGAVAKRILQEQGEQVGSKLIGNSLRSVIEKNIAKTPLTGLLGEVAEESGVEFGNQANDIAFGIRDDFDYKSIANAGLSSTGFGGVNTVSVYGAKAYMSAKKYNQVKNTNKAISRLQNEINNEGISEESKKIFQIKSDELVASNKKLLGEEIEKLKTLSSEDKELLNKTNTIIDDVMSSIDTIKDDKTLSPEAKKIAVNEIYKDYVEAQKTKKQILSKLDNVQVEGDFSNFTGVPLDFNVETSGVSALPIGEQDRLNRQALESLNSELNPTGTEQVDITRDMVSKKAYELYNEEQKAKENIVEEVATEEVKVSSPDKSKNSFIDGDDLLLNHGSPHDFDKFQLEKIGTGEGAQAFGYGLYFTDGSKIAERYARKLSEDKTGVVYNVRIKGGAKKEWVEWREPLTEEQDSQLYNSLTEEELAQYQEHLDKSFYPESKNYDPKYEKDYHGAFDDLKTNKYGFRIEEKQSSVGRIYSDLKDAFGQAKATEIFKRINIDGIKYRSNKGYGENYNYVVFDPNSIEIEKKSNEKVTDTDSTEPVIEDTQVKDVKEPTEVKDQAIDIFKAGLEAIKVAKATSKAKLKSVTDVIDSLTKGEDGKTKSGKITVKQANSLIKRIGILNLDNPKTTEKLIDYASKIIENANYKDKLDDLDTTISSIKTKLKSKDIDPDLKDLAKKLISIKTKYIDDIDGYFEVLSNVNNNIKGSTSRGGKLNISEGIDKKKLSEYINKETDNYKSLEIQDVMNSFYDNLGLNPADFSYEEIQEIMYEPNGDSKLFEKYDKLDLNHKIKKASESMKAIVKDMIQNRIDSFSLDRINISEEQKSNIKKLLDINVDELSKQDSLLYIDTLNDIIVNGDSNKIESIVNVNEANKKAKEFSESNKASKLKLFFSTSLGKFWNKQFSSLYNITENLFKGFGAGNKFMEAIGFPEIQKGAIKAQVKTDLFFSNIGNKYFKTNPNGLKFNDSYNKYERGIAAALIRSTKGNEDVDFQKEKTLLENSIDVLSKGNKEERERAVEYKKVYDKLFVDNNSLNAEDILKNIDETNKQVVLDVIEEYKKQKQDKDDVARKYYNISLGDEQNYTPISYAKLSYDSSKAEDVDSFSTSLLDNSQSVYDKKSGSFIPAVKPSGIKKGSYRDYDFEYVNINGMKASLTDVNTAKHIQYLKTFIESDSFSKIIEDPEDRRLFISRIKDFVDIKRGRENYFANKSEIKPILNVFRKISNLGATKVLGSATQILKQPIPPAVNTIINAGRLDLIDAFDSDWNDFINDSGFEISIRGLESSSDYIKMNDLIDAASKTKGEQLMKLLSNQQDFFLKNFLAKPDVFIARASWISFYKQYLKDRGIDISDIKDHEINEDAAMYAQRQVDRQQNVSDTALEGKWFTSKDPGVQISRMFLLPFAKFALNQKSRLYSDLRTLSSTDNIWSKDKTVAAKSFVGMAVEMAAFRMISGYISQLIVEVMNNLTGYEESDEEKEKRRKTMIESQTKNTIVDYFSPFPATDPIVLFGFNKVLDQIQDEYGVKGKDKLDIGTHIDKDLFDKFGMIGIGLKGISEIAEYEKLTITGEYKKNGVTRKISEEDKKNLEDFRTLFYLYQLGLLPSEFGSVSRRLQKIAESREKKRKTMKLY